MAIQTGQRTTQNSSDTKTKEQRSKAATTRKSRNRASTSTSTEKVAKKDQGKKIELDDNPFTDEKVEVYHYIDADVERREDRAPAADPIKTATVGKDGVLKLEGLKRGTYLVYAPESQNWLQVQSK